MPGSVAVCRAKPKGKRRVQDEWICYPCGNDDPTADLLNFNKIIGGTTKVGSYPNGASLTGALDMVGNVSEWTADWHAVRYYDVSPIDNPMGPDSASFESCAGAWCYRDTYARSIHRNRGVPTKSHNFIGFRWACSQE